MLAKKYRLPWGIRFDNSRSISSSFFAARVKPNKLLLNRFGVVIGKKIDKRAVNRNRIKRLIHTVIQELQDDAKQGFDFLFIARRSAVGKTKNDFHLVIKEMLGKEGLLK